MTIMPIVVVGGGGHAAVVIEALRAEGKWVPAAVVDRGVDATDVLGAPVVGGDEELPLLYRQGLRHAVVAVGSNRIRQALGEGLLAQGFALPAVVHPTALVSPSSALGAGVVVMARACIGARAQVGDLAVINTGAIVEHDNRIGAGAHVCPGVALAGNVTVGDRALIGVGSAARPGVCIGADVVVGAGSSLISDIADGLRVGGCPARPLRASV